MNKNFELNLKYALVNAFYFMLVCGSGSYGYNFLKYSEFDTSVIGITLTLVSVLALVLQTYMAPVIDRSEKWNEKKLILTTLIIAIILYAAMLVIPEGSFALLTVCVIGFALTVAGMPFINSLAFAYEQEGKKINYGIGRGIGSAAYAVGGAVIGGLVAWQGGADEMIVKIFPYYMIVTGILTVLCLLTMKDPKKVSAEHTEGSRISYREFFRKYKKITVVIAAMIMLFFCHMMINTYMIDVIKEIGGNTADQGNAIFIQAMAELPTMFLFALILKKFKVNTLMIFASVCYVLKHALICFAPSMPVYYAAMILQMFSYAILIPASVYFAEEHVAPQDRNQGQTVMNAATTIGGLLASLFGGILLSVMSVHGVLLIGLAATVIGAVLMFFGIRVLNKAE
jgi:PPP family 3-phenylpropionic acid transporter